MVGLYGQHDVVLADREIDVTGLERRVAGGERAAGEPNAALASYREALAIDAAWQPAHAAIAEDTAEIRNAELERHLSAGFAALAGERFADAMASFRAALALQGDARGAQDGLTQAEQGLKLERIALTEARALAFERRELWDQAIEQYREVLATDSTLVFAQAGLERAEGRAGLDAKLENLIGNPTLLFSDSVLADARALLDEARAEADPGPRLGQRIGELDRLIRLAATPIPVQIQSDQLTEVMLYRVGALGVFASKQVELRPGTYTAIGSRDGYRDVRQTFTVVPGRTLPPISVVCVEPI